VRQLPRGTVTFLFTDIEGSTRLLHELGDAYADALAQHRRLLREAFQRYGGVEVDTQGDAFFVAFPRASDALAAAADGRDALASTLISVRIGVHTGEPLLTDEGYVGLDVHRAARIAAAGHGGQILVSQSARELAGGDDLLDLGEHRLKDLIAPERIYQLGPGDFPPLKSLNQTNLPVQPSPLVGREQELPDVLSLLSTAPVLTLTGAGGSGKTRLALQAAAEVVEQYRDGVWWVPLAAVKDPELVMSAVAQVVGARDGLADHLRSQQTLLLLDNLEQLIAAAPGIASLLSEAPGVRVLATSRERLGLSIEQEYAVPPLAPSAAVALFTARARQLTPAFAPDEHVEEICRRLDCLPLALELAAARIKVLRPGQILGRLERSLDLLTAGARDAPVRQRTLRGAIAWSHELLSEDEQLAFARLAVFPGSFELEAAESVCGADIDLIASLVDKSLLRQTAAGRFFMLETIREFAGERFAELPDVPDNRQRHAEHFLALAEAQPEPRGPDAPAVLERLDSEHDNLLAALAWLLETGQLELEQRLAVALSAFWDVRGYPAEGQRWLEVPWGSETQLRAKALARAASLAANRGRFADAGRLVDESLALSRKLDDGESIFRAQTIAGLLALRQGDFDRAKGLLEDARRQARELGETWILGADSNLGYGALTWGDLDRAVRVLEDGRARAKAMGDPVGELTSVQNLAIAMLFRGRADQAAPLLRDGVELARSLGFGTELAYCLEGFAALHVAAGRWALSARLLAAADRIHSDLGERRELVEERLYERTRREVEEHLDPSELEAARAEGAKLTSEDAVELALAPPD
jgi:predicted ATPase